ncbi:MAG: substrate-binding domain-containing protein [Planctomycetota bacterium]|nr:substrate-binding domain-containing protein [Planctomycetota bacterium]
MAQTLTERFLAKLRGEILSGQKVAREGVLNESLLCKRYSISRITVRRILAQLCAENLLINIPCKGYVLGPAAHFHRAKASRIKRDRILYVLSPDAQSVQGSYHARQLWQGMEAEARERGLAVELCRMPLDRLFAHLRAEHEKHLLGVALEWYDRQVAELLLIEGIPGMIAEYHHPGLLQDAVTQDNGMGVAQAVDHLWGLGHRAIGMLAWANPQGYYHSSARRAGLLQALIRHGAVETGLIGASERFDAEGGREAVRALLDLETRPTAIILSHLEMAAGALEELQQRKLRVPEDVSVIAWGTPETQAESLHGTPWADFPLDLIGWPREELGRLAVRTIQARHLNPLAPPLHLQIPTNLVLRGSSRAPAR